MSPSPSPRLPAVVTGLPNVARQRGTGERAPRRRAPGVLGMAARSETITGVPDAMAPRMGSPCPSKSEGYTKAPAAE